MIDTRLILFDGIAGSGKTTNSQWLYVALLKAGVSTDWITESQKDHPVYQRDVAEARTTDEAIERAIRSWRRFAGARASAPGVSVMDGSILDSPISFLLLQDTAPERIALAVSEMVAAAKGLQPVLFHFYQDDIDEAIETTCRRRGDGWRQHLISYVSASAFARHRQLSGIEAPRVYYREHRRIADLAFEGLDIRRLAIGTSAARWNDYRAQIVAFLGASLDVRAGSEEMDWSAFTGEYRDTEHDRPWRVVSVDRSLFLDGDARMKLVHIAGTRFFIEGQPVELRFEGTDRGTADRIHYLSMASDGLKSELTWVRVTGT